MPRIQIHAHMRRLASEAGAASVEATIAFPFLLALMFGIIQGAATLHAGNVAQAVAHMALEHARTYDGTTDGARQAGLDAASATGAALTEVEVEVVFSGDSVTVTVTGTAPSLVPGMPISIAREVSAPRERWID